MDVDVKLAKAARVQGVGMVLSSIVSFSYSKARRKEAAVHQHCFVVINPLTPILPNGYSYKASCARPG